MAEPHITRHAWLRFIARFTIYEGELPPCPFHELRRLLALAQPEDLGAGHALRLLNNDLQPALYLAYKEWRFVLTEDGSRLLTVERRIYKKRPHRKTRWRR